MVLEQMDSHMQKEKRDKEKTFIHTLYHTQNINAKPSTKKKLS